MPSLLDYVLDELQAATNAHAAAQRSLGVHLQEISARRIDLGPDVLEDIAIVAVTSERIEAAASNLADALRLRGQDA